MSVVSKKTRFSVLSRDGFRCRYCGKEAGAAELHIDHVTPRADGGTNKAWNLVTACADCNLGKGRRTPAKAAEQAIQSESMIADDRTVAACESEQDAVIASIVLSGLTYREIAARMGVSKSLVNALSKGERELTHKRTSAFCNATGTHLIRQYRDLARALEDAAGRTKERNRIAAIVAPTERAWRAAA